MLLIWICLSDSHLPPLIVTATPTSLSLILNHMAKRRPRLYGKSVIFSTLPVVTFHPKSSVLPARSRSVSHGVTSRSSSSPWRTPASRSSSWVALPSVSHLLMDGLIHVLHTSPHTATQHVLTGQTTPKKRG